MVRVLPVMVNVAFDRMSFELLPHTHLHGTRLHDEFAGKSRVLVSLGEANMIQSRRHSRRQKGGVSQTTERGIGRNRVVWFPTPRVVFAAFFMRAVSTAAFQRLRVSATVESATAADAGAQLLFSRNGQLLYALGKRALTYNASSAVITHIVDIEPGAQVFAISPAAPTALLGVPFSGTRVRLRLLDLNNGQLQDLPSNWYDADNNGPIAAISGDGRLISLYSEDGPAGQSMTVTVYNWPARTLASRQMSEYIAAGGGFGGGVTVDGLIEFVNNRNGRKLVDLKTGRLIAVFGFSSLRSPNGAWVVELPNRTFNESAPKDVVVKDGATAAIRGRLEAQIEDREAYAGIVDGAFCGTTGRFVLARHGSVAVYSIPSGSLLANLPAVSWQDTSAASDDRVHAACSSNGDRIAVLSGNRLTIHELR